MHSGFKTFDEVKQYINRYPQVEHKLPELFQIIIKLDKLLELFYARRVVPFKKLQAAKKRILELTQAAEKFMQPSED